MQQDTLKQENSRINDSPTSRDLDTQRETVDTSSGRLDQGQFVQRVLITVGITLASVILLFLLWQALDVFLVAFAGILLAIFLRSLSNGLRKVAPLSNGQALAVVLIVLALLIGAGVWFLAPDITNQLVQLVETLPQALERLIDYFAAQGWSQEIFSYFPSLNEFMSNQMNIVSQITSLFSTTLGAVINLAIVLFIGIYIAAAPEYYIDGFIRLFPMNRRPRIYQVMAEMGHTLQRWLVGQLTAMTLIGILTAIGLWIIGVPLALTLALVAAALNFVPYFGPVLAAVPAVSLALLEGPTLVLYVVILYMGIQIIESYLVTPLVQQQAVLLPPAVIITAQILLGVVAGGLGILLATPLTAATVVAVRMLYVEDALDG